MSILKPTEIDVSRMRYSEAKQNAAGGRTVYINYAGDDGRDGKMYIQTPTMYLPWGLSAWENKKFNIDINWVGFKGSARLSTRDNPYLQPLNRVLHLNAIPILQFQ